MKLGMTILALAAALCGCAQIQQFTAGDLSNAAALAGSGPGGGRDPVGAGCWDALGNAAAATPIPANDGVAVLAERKRLAEAAISGPCGAVIAPALLKVLHL
jgi:hypothetical protein